MAKELLFVAGIETEGNFFADLDSNEDKAFGWYPWRKLDQLNGNGFKGGKIINNHIYHWQFLRGGWGRMIKTSLEGTVIWDTGALEVVDDATLFSDIQEPKGITLYNNNLSVHGTHGAIILNDVDGSLVRRKEFAFISAGNKFFIDSFGNAYYGTSSVALTKLDLLWNTILVSTDPGLATFGGTLHFKDLDFTSFIIMDSDTNKIMRVNKITLNTMWVVDLAAEGFTSIPFKYCVNSSGTHLLIPANNGVNDVIIEMDISDGNYVNHNISLPFNVTSIMSVTNIFPALSPGKAWIVTADATNGDNKCYYVNAGWLILDYYQDQASLSALNTPYVSGRGFNNIQHLSFTTYDYTGTVSIDGSVAAGDNDARMILLNPATGVVVDSTISNLDTGAYTMKALENVPHLIIVEEPIGTTTCNHKIKVS